MADASVEGAYDRGELTFARFEDACPRCRWSRPSASSFLCVAKGMRVFADTTCDGFEPTDPDAPFVDVEIRRKLYRANLKIEIALEQHRAAQTKVAAANGGRVG